MSNRRGRKGSRLTRLEGLWPELSLYPFQNRHEHARSISNESPEQNDENNHHIKLEAAASRPLHTPSRPGRGAGSSGIHPLRSRLSDWPDFRVQPRGRRKHLCLRIEPSGRLGLRRQRQPFRGQYWQRPDYEGDPWRRRIRLRLWPRNSGGLGL